MLSGEPEWVGMSSASCSRGWRAGYRDGTAHIDYEIVWEGVDSAYTIGYERAFVSIDGNEAAVSTIRITHIHRREGGRWMLVHRHGDFAPVNESPRPTDDPS